MTFTIGQRCLCSTSSTVTPDKELQRSGKFQKDLFNFRFFYQIERYLNIRQQKNPVQFLAVC